MFDLVSRSPVPEDVDEIVALVTRCDALTANWVGAEWALPEGHSERERAIWVEELANGDFRAEVALTKGGVIAGVVATNAPCHVNSLFVEPSMHGQGIGAALLARAEEWLLADGCEDATLNVLECAPARSFYEARGWRHDGTRGHFDWFDLPTLGYVKTLAA